MKFAIAIFALSIGCGPKSTNTVNNNTNNNNGDTGDTNNGTSTTGDVEPWVAATPPQAQELTFPDSDAFRTKQPEASKARPFNLPAVQKSRLPNGMTAYLIEDNTLPTVTATISFDGGGLVDPDGKVGRSEVCMDLMTEGTEKLNKIQFEMAKGDLASSISSYSSGYTHGLQLRSLTRNFDKTNELLADTIKTPGFREGDLKRIISREVQSLSQQKASPGGAAARATRAALWGAKHPNGRLVTEQSLQAITVDDCKTFAAKYVKPGNAKLFVVGNIKMATLKSTIGSLPGWKGKVPNLKRIAKPKGLPGRLFVINKEGAAQSAIRVFHTGPTRKAGDYFDTWMMSNVLGGGFSSRINMNLREAKGYSYGAGGRFNYNKWFSVYSVGSSVRTNASYQSVLEILREIEDIKGRKKSITQEEIEREKRGAVLALPGWFSNARSSLQRYQDLVYFGLPLNYYNSFARNVNRVTLKKAQRATRHLNPNQIKVVVVGDLNAAMIVQDGNGKDVPYMKDGKAVTLGQALDELASKRKWGAVVKLDEDGKVIK